MNTTNRHVYPQEIFTHESSSDECSDEPFKSHGFDKKTINAKKPRRRLDNICGATHTRTRGTQPVRVKGSFKINEERIPLMERKGLSKQNL